MTPIHTRLDLFTDDCIIWRLGGDTRQPRRGMEDITVVCGECGGSGCRKCNFSGTVTIVE